MALPGRAHRSGGKRGGATVRSDRRVARALARRFFAGESFAELAAAMGFTVEQVEALVRTQSVVRRTR